MVVTLFLRTFFVNKAVGYNFRAVIRPTCRLHDAEQVTEIMFYARQIHFVKADEIRQMAVTRFCGLFDKLSERAFDKFALEITITEQIGWIIPVRTYRY